MKYTDSLILLGKLVKSQDLDIYAEMYIDSREIVVCRVILYYIIIILTIKIKTETKLKFAENEKWLIFKRLFLK